MTVFPIRPDEQTDTKEYLRYMIERLEYTIERLEKRIKALESD